MKRARFGRSSERIDQLELLVGDLEEAEAEHQAREATAQRAADQPVSKAGAPRPRGRQPLPAHLPRERVVHAPVGVCPACGDTCLTRLGEDAREVLEYVPSHFKVVVHVRPRMSCRACEMITQVPAPMLPIERGRPGPGLLAHVLVAKYCDHAPLYRQSVIYGRAGGPWLRIERLKRLTDYRTYGARLVRSAHGNARLARRHQQVTCLDRANLHHSRAHRPDR